MIVERRAVMEGRSIFQGKVTGMVVKLDEAFSFLGGVDASTGQLKVGSRGNIAGNIFVFPKGKGSTVGSFVMYDLMVHGKAPAAVVNRSAETIVTTGAVISSIPMVDRIDVDTLNEGDTVTVDGTAGTVEIEGVRCIRAVLCAIVVDGRILVLHRPKTARSFADGHSLVTGKIEEGETEVEAAKREIMEETGILIGEPELSLGAIHVREGNILWEVTPFLFRSDRVEPVLNHENTGFEWMTADDIRADPKMVTGTPEIVIEMLKSI